MLEDRATIILTFVVYVVILLTIGWLGYRRTRNLADYILGGRRLGRWVSALSAGASDMSGWLLLGLPGYAYLAGFEAGWIALGLLIGTYLNWRIVAARLRAYSAAADDALTLSEFFEHRFEDNTKVLRVVSAAFILLFYFFYTSAGLVAGGKLFETVFDMPYSWAVAAGTGVILLYTSVGGFLAVSWTDLVQGLLMALALVAVPIVAIIQLGGWEAMIGAMSDSNPALLDVFTSSDGNMITAIAILSLLGWGLGYFGQPHILARFMAIRSTQAVAGARRIAISWTGLTLMGAILVGVAGIGYLTNAPLEGANVETVFMVLVEAFFHPIPASICLAAILAAIMSTADSQLLVSSSALAEDFYKALFRRNASERELVRVGRAAVILIAVIAFGLALDPNSKVLELVAYAWAGLGAAFGPTLILSLYWKRMTRIGALAGIMTGGLTVVIWKQLQGGIFDLYELVPGFALSFLAIIITSLASRPPSAKTLNEFDSITAEIR